MIIAHVYVNSLFLFTSEKYFIVVLRNFPFVIYMHLTYFELMTITYKATMDITAWVFVNTILF